MMVRINGLCSQIDAMYANMVSPDMVGLVFQGPGANITRESVESVISMLGRIPRVGMFVDESPDVIASYLEDGLIDVVEIPAGNDTYVDSVHNLGCPISIRYNVRSESDLASIGTTSSDHIVIDLGDSPDLSLVKDIQYDYCLSADLTPSNILSVIREVAPYGVETMTGAMTNGSLDPTKMTAFAYAARGDFEPIIEHH